jgi:hypothetical protein
MIDVISPNCIEPNCETRPRFGKPGYAAERCAVHRQPGDISNPKRRCETANCKNFALFGMDSEPKFCELHKSDEHLNLVYQICIVCSLLELVDDEQKCTRCSDYLRKRLHCRKQRLVKSWLDTSENMLKYTLYDRQVDGGACGRERPDFMWDVGTHAVVLEVDEFQHQSTPCDCEQVRMANVTNSIGMPCIWIRFNPDDYKCSGSKMLKDAERRDLLIRVLRTAFISLPSSPLEYCRVQHLCFDGFKLGDVIPFQIIPMV